MTKCVQHFQTRNFWALTIFPDMFEITIETYESNGRTIWREMELWLHDKAIPYRQSYSMTGGWGYFSFKNEAALAMFLMEWR